MTGATEAKCFTHVFNSVLNSLNVILTFHHFKRKAWLKNTTPPADWNNYKQTLHLFIHYLLCIPIIAVTFKKKGFSTKARHATDLLSHNRRGRRNGSIYSARHRDAVQRLGKWRAVGAIESRRASKCFFVFDRMKQLGLTNIGNR